MKKALITIGLILISVLSWSCGGRSDIAVVRAEQVTLSPIDRKISDALQQIEAEPGLAKPYVQAAAFYIQKARMTGDFSLNGKAEIAVAKALEIDPNDVRARKVQASLYLTYHRFEKARDAAEALRDEFPKDAFVYGVLTDANVELGNYVEAVRTAQAMVDIKPNAASYARVGHLRSLYGDHDGAVEMMKLAARTADPDDKEAQSWCLTQLGDEMWKYGKFADAEKIYDEALRTLPDYCLAMVGKGRTRASQNDLAAAEAILAGVTDRVPNVEAQILLGEIFLKQGDTARAEQAFDLVEVIEARIGVNNDQKRLSLMWSDNRQRPVDALAIAEREHAERKDIFTADALAWALYRSGRFAEARAAATEASRLGSNDARILYHAGMIEIALGNETAGRKLLANAIRINPGFDLVQAEKAISTLAQRKAAKG